MPPSFTLFWTATAGEQYKQLESAANLSASSKSRQKPSRQQGLLKQVRKALALLQQNPRHPGLNSHPFDSLEHPYHKNSKVWVSYAQNKTPGAYRIFWCYGLETGQLTIIAITAHP